MSSSPFPVDKLQNHHLLPPTHLFEKSLEFCHRVCCCHCLRSYFGALYVFVCVDTDLQYRNNIYCLESYSCYLLLLLLKSILPWRSKKPKNQRQYYNVKHCSSTMLCNKKPLSTITTTNKKKTYNRLLWLLPTTKVQQY